MSCIIVIFIYNTFLNELYYSYILFSRDFFEGFWRIFEFQLKYVTIIHVIYLKKHFTP